MPKQPSVAAASAEGTRSLSITSTRPPQARHNPAEQPRQGGRQRAHPDLTWIELVGELGRRNRLRAGQLKGPDRGGRIQRRVHDGLDHILTVDRGEPLSTAAQDGDAPALPG